MFSKSRKTAHMTVDTHKGVEQMSFLTFINMKHGGSYIMWRNMNNDGGHKGLPGPESISKDRYCLIIILLANAEQFYVQSV